MRYAPPTKGTAKWHQHVPMSPEALKNAAREIKQGKMTAGGKRKGAGRKPRSTPREPISVKIEPEHAEKFRAICKANERSQAEQLTEWIKRARF